jgi:hypothetical protein
VRSTSRPSARRLIKNAGEAREVIFEKSSQTFIRCWRYFQRLQSLLREQTDNKASQSLLMQSYRMMAVQNKNLLPKISDIGFRQYSQNEEDGIILYIFALAATTNKKCLEICVADGSQCNTANLILNHGWWGTMFDGSAENIQRARQLYDHHPDTFIYPPKIKQAWITAEGVNQSVIDAGLSGPIDLLSIDVDGNDYWVWKALNVVDPRVVVIEYMNPIPPNLAITIPYKPDFSMDSSDDDFRGASLLAMVKLGRERGYRLVGTNRYGFNAFFMKNGICDDLLPEVTPESCANDLYTQDAQRTRWPRVASKNWVEV